MTRSELMIALLTVSILSVYMGWYLRTDYYNNRKQGPFNLKSGYTLISIPPSDKYEKDCIMNILNHNPTIYRVSFDKGGIIATENMVVDSIDYYTATNVGKNIYELYKDKLSGKSVSYTFKKVKK